MLKVYKIFVKVSLHIARCRSLLVLIFWLPWVFQMNLLTFQEECLKGVTVLISEQSWGTVTSGMTRD